MASHIAGASRTSKIALIIKSARPWVRRLRLLAVVWSHRLRRPVFHLHARPTGRSGQDHQGAAPIMHHVVKDAGARTKLRKRAPALRGRRWLGGCGGREKPGFQLELGLAVDACASDDHCPGETKCSYVAAGRRCLPEPTASCSREFRALDPGSEKRPWLRRMPSCHRLSPRQRAELYHFTRVHRRYLVCGGVRQCASLCGTESSRAARRGLLRCRAGRRCVWPGCKGALCARLPKARCW